MILCFDLFRLHITRILDLNFLLIYHAAKKEDIETLKRYIYVLEVLHGEKVDSKYNKLVKLLKYRED